MKSCLVTSYTLSCKQVGSTEHIDDFEQLHSLISGLSPKSCISHNLLYKLAVCLLFVTSVHFSLCKLKTRKRKRSGGFNVFNLGKCCMTAHLHCCPLASCYYTVWTKWSFWQLFISGNCITNKIISFRNSYFIFVGIKEQK